MKMLVFGITIAIIFVLLFFFAFRLVSKVLYVIFLVRFFTGMGKNMVEGITQQKGANADESNGV